MHSPLGNQGSFKIGIDAPEPMRHLAPPRTINLARIILRQT